MAKVKLNKKKPIKKQVSEALDNGFAALKNIKMAKAKAVMAKINKAMKKDNAVYLGTEQRPFTRIPTGCIAFDYVTGGGLVRGQMFQFTGVESSSKTTVSLIAAAAVQKMGGIVVWVAGEGFDKDWAAQHGVDLDALIIVMADIGDVALEKMLTLIEETMCVDLVVIDSVQSLGTTREMENGVDDEAYGSAGAPQMWARVMRRMYSLMNKMPAGTEPAIIAISQARSAIGKRGFKGMAPEPEGSGIFALKHWKAAEIYFKKGEYEREEDGSDLEGRDITSREFKLKCLKNKTSKQGRESKYEMTYDDEGSPHIDNAGTLMRLAKLYGFITVKGAWYEGYGVRGQGEDNFRAKLKPGTMDKMMKDILEEMQ